MPGVSSCGARITVIAIVIALYFPINYGHHQCDPSHQPRRAAFYEDTHCSEIFALIMRLRGKDTLQEVDSSPVHRPHILMPAAGYIYLCVVDGGGGCPVRAYKVSPVQIQRSVLGPTLLQHSLIRPSHLQPHSPHSSYIALQSPRRGVLK